MDIQIIFWSLCKKTKIVPNFCLIVSVHFVFSASFLFLCVNILVFISVVAPDCGSIDVTIYQRTKPLENQPDINLFPKVKPFKVNTSLCDAVKEQQPSNCREGLQSTQEILLTFCSVVGFLGFLQHLDSCWKEDSSVLDCQNSKIWWECELIKRGSRCMTPSRLKRLRSPCFYMYS